MWRVREFANGQELEKNPRFFSDDEQPPVLERYLGELRSLLDSVETEAPLGLIHRYVEGGPVVAGDAISIWGGGSEESWSLLDDETQAQTERHTVRFVDGQKLEWRIDDEFVSSAWHANTIALIPLRAGVEEIEISNGQYGDSEQGTGGIVLGPRASLTLGTHQLEQVQQYLDLRVFMGTNSSAQDGLIRGSKIVLHKSAKATGVLVGKVVNLSSRKPWRFRRDPLRTRRISEYEKQFPTIRQAIPDLKSLSGKASMTSAIVAVHGLFSCGINVASHFEKPKLESPMYRFEHDTFVNVTENAKELVDLVLQKLDAQKLLLVAHSRGGLVARTAAAMLESIGAIPSVEVWTYGTPHKGTPLVYAGQRTMGALYNLGGAAVGSILAAWSLPAALRYLLGPSELPQGVQDLEPGRSFLELLDSTTATCLIRSFAGDFDPQTSSSSGYGVIFTSTLGQVAFGEKNDLVVPTSSAEAAGTPHRVNDCDHFSYFKDPKLQNQIIRWPRP